MPTYTIYVRDASLNRVCEVDDFMAPSFILRFNRPGAWTLKVPIGSTAAQELNKLGAGIVITRDGQTLMSGPVKVRQRVWNNDEDSLQVSGPDDTRLLLERLAYPVPSGPPYTAASHDVRAGPAESVMTAYVLYNAGAAANPERQILGLTVAADTGTGNTVTGRARFQPLLELLQSLAIAGGDMGFRIVQVGSSLQFQTFLPADRTRTAVFSEELGNLQGFEYTFEAPAFNYVVAGGGGEGTARTVVEGGDSASIAAYGRIESFRDTRNTTDPAEMTQTIRGELATSAEKAGLKINPIDTESVAFLTSYNLGDKVTVVVDGVAIRDVVREVTISLDSGAEKILPLVGTPGAESVPKLFKHMGRVESRLSNLERR